MEEHAHLLRFSPAGSEESGRNWRKHVQDTMSHNNMFTRGEVDGKGWWGLNYSNPDVHDPWDNDVVNNSIYRAGPALPADSAVVDAPINSAAPSDGSNPSGSRYGVAKRARSKSRSKPFSGAKSSIKRRRRDAPAAPAAVAEPLNEETQGQRILVEDMQKLRKEWLTRMVGMKEAVAGLRKTRQEKHQSNIAKFGQVSELLETTMPSILNMIEGLELLYKDIDNIHRCHDKSPEQHQEGLFRKTSMAIQGLCEMAQDPSQSQFQAVHRCSISFITDPVGA